MNQAPTKDKSSLYNIKARDVGLINQAPTKDKSSLYNIKARDVGLMNQAPTQDKSNSCCKNSWLAITYYFKDSKKCCHGTLCVALIIKFNKIEF